jgi:hypothetical protein
MEEVDHPTAGFIGADEIEDVKAGFTKEAIATLGFQRQDAALNGGDLRGYDIAVPLADLRPALHHVKELPTKIIQGQQPSAFIIGFLQRDGHGAGLSLVQAQHAGGELGAHFLQAWPDWKAMDAEQILEGGEPINGEGAPELAHPLRQR